jgi:hypothetical protein
LRSNIKELAVNDASVEVRCLALEDSIIQETHKNHHFSIITASYGLDVDLMDIDGNPLQAKYPPSLNARAIDQDGVTCEVEADLHKVCTAKELLARLTGE